MIEDPTDEVLASAIAKLETTGFNDLTDKEGVACVWATRAQQARRVSEQQHGVRIWAYPDHRSQEQRASDEATAAVVEPLLGPMAEAFDGMALRADIQEHA